MHSGILRLAVPLVLLAATPSFLAQDVPPGTLLHAIPNSELSYAVYAADGETRYAVRDLAGSTLLDRPLDARIRLRAKAFDPRIEAAPVPAAVLAARPSNRLWIVQYAIPGVPQFRAEVRAAGGEVVSFLPEGADVVNADASSVAAIRGLDCVRWVGAYHPDYRTDDAGRVDILRGRSARKYNVFVTHSGRADKESLAQFLREVGGRHEPVIPFGHLLTIEATPDVLLEVIHRNEVLFLDAYGDLEPDLAIARDVGGANFLEGVSGYTGQGVRGEVFDTGLVVGHQEFSGPVIHGSNTSDTSHGTSVYGIVFGQGIDPTARGILPDGVGFFGASSGLLGNAAARYPHTAQLLLPPYEAVFQTNSTGSPRTFFYTTISADMDDMLFDLDFVICQSQSNAGNQDSRPEAWAKNIVSGGGIRHFDTATLADDSWTAGASIGPAQDGRIKPTISMFYDSIRTTANTSTTAYTNTFGGTSGATPLIAGHVGILHQMYAEGAFGNAANPAAGVFANRPHMTTMKGILTATSRQYTFSGANADLTRNHQGWGLPSLENAWNLRNRMVIVDESDVLAPFQSSRYHVDVTATDPELRAVMIFADPAGNPAALESRVNDLSLRVTDPTGVVYWGNHGLVASNFSTPGGTPDTNDTVEVVIVPSPVAGTWTVDVIAFEINADSHVETAAIDADYSLVVTGASLSGTSPTTPTGQANSALASLFVLSALNSANQAAFHGVPGPFAADVGAGLPMSLLFGGQASQPFLLLLGPTNSNNAVFPSVGSLDLGLLGSGNLSDVGVVMNGFSPVGFFDSLAILSPGGSQGLSFTPPLSLSGTTIGGFQAAMQHAGGVALSAAVEIRVN